ncbi:hypothetical protein AJ80_04525 [Polytolypa hystricis UAMH7299]|uniref:Rhamnogalacturonan endolyase n=1 Tax=Polytolypa hystricis (strain UAMH7299) TaxID=1447883 RepID=A0A2B7YCM6_POLH7|nr:hypothetical protein AJ80_04525 [Polytolypa hystricis UAMH7299]
MDWATVLRCPLLLLWLSFLCFANATVEVSESSGNIVLSNDRLHTELNKANGIINRLTLDGQDLLGQVSGSQGLYVDCYCTPDGFWTPGTQNVKYTVIRGVDPSGVAYAGMVMSDTYRSTGQVFEQYWFLRDGETGLHGFTRIAYYNERTPFLRNLQELRTLFRPNSQIWTDLSTKKSLHAPLPRPNPANGGEGVSTSVQDATWDLSERTNDPFVQQAADFYTKYTFHDTWRDHDVHGLFADGSVGNLGSTFGAWLVMNTKDTYFGGPLHSDLMVDGILYNYMVSNHHGAGTPNITHGFDRTIGPYYYYFNKGARDSGIDTLRKDALKYYSPGWATEFYDAIAQHVPNYVTTRQRGSWKAKLDLPPGAKNPIAVLSVSGVDFQDNVEDAAAYQYWADIDSSGLVNIDRVKADTYRLTVYADGIFAQYEQDGIVINPARQTDSGTIRWTAESAGKELWRIGTPDKSSGEYRHGRTPDPTHPLQLPEHLIYWGAYDFVEDFPDGVTFTVGESKESEDFNYVQWSVFGGKGNSRRPEPYVGNGNVNNWTIAFDVQSQELGSVKEATLTIQLAGAKTAAGNTDVFDPAKRYNDLPLSVVVNDHALESWIIPWYHSSSCVVRSAITCYNIRHKFRFPAEYLYGDERNEIILSLPYNAVDPESAVLPESVYIQYDALRLEVQ